MEGGMDAVTELKFSSEYIFNSESTWATINVFFWLFFWLMLIVLLIFTYSLCTESQASNSSQNERLGYIILKTIVNLADYFSAIFFWFIFGVSLYWFIFFKLQERVYCFLPPSNGKDDVVVDADFSKVLAGIIYDDYTPRNTLFFWVVLFKLIVVFYRIAFE